MDSIDEIADRFGEKKAAAIAKANKTGEEVKELSEEEKQFKADKEARDEANKAHKTADELKKDNGGGKSEDFADANGKFVPPELRKPQSLVDNASNLGESFEFDPYRGTVQ